MKKTDIFLAILLSGLIILAGCSGKNNFRIPPEGIIPHKKMANLLADIHLAESALSQQQLTDKDFKYYTATYYSVVFKKHHTNRKQFEASMKYYSENQDEMGLIYDQVIVILSGTDANK